jgi:hypothetical protein
LGPSRSDIVVGDGKDVVEGRIEGYGDEKNEYDGQGDDLGDDWPLRCD